MYAGALVPGLVLTGLYMGYILLVTLVKPDHAPALPLEARSLRGWKLVVRVLVSLVPPLVLIFLVLGTIFIGIATPTEGGAMGAVGAVVLALINRRLDFALLRQAMDQTAKLTCFVIFILVGATVFGLVFRGVNGDIWVEELLTALPGGQLGFLVVVNIMVFLLAFFLDFFELAFIIVPLLAPAADKLGIDLIWFGVLLAVNMQTSFMHPPFGFALFYLRSVAPAKDYIDKVTGKLTARITTGQIYWGSVPFVCIQLIMVALVIAFPSMVFVGLNRGEPIDMENFQMEIPDAPDYGSPPAPFGLEPPADGSAPPAEEDPNAAIMRQLQGQ
jgi:tripartite ATP-independent transporter DctM subunit